MENTKVTRHWGVAAIIIAGVVIVAGVILFLMVPGRALQAQAEGPPVIIQWQPQSIPEAKLRAKILEHNVQIHKGLKAIAENPSMGPRDVAKYFEKTYFENPRLWQGKGWVEGWDKVEPLLKNIIKPGSTPVITSITAVIDYQTYADAPTAGEDVDAIAHIKFTFSASPGDNLAEGILKHSRLCEWY